MPLRVLYKNRLHYTLLCGAQFITSILYNMFYSTCNVSRLCFRFYHHTILCAWISHQEGYLSPKRPWI
jgi:hypothetical protein